MTDAAAPAITLNRLVKRFGRVTAVDGVTLSVARGETLGFLGANGAGKTTTIRILLNLLRPTSGSACLFGHDCQAAGCAARDAVGYLPADFGLYPDMTGQDVLDLCARLERRPPDAARRRALLERFEFPQAHLARRLRECSTGMRRKLGLVQAFQSAPRLVILDEPTEGLDPLMQEAFFALLADVRRDGTTIFVSSHVLSEVERTCDRVAVIAAGRLTLVAPVDEVRRLAPRRVRVVFARDVAPPPPLGGGIAVDEAAPRAWRLTATGPLGPLLDALSGQPVADIEIAEPRLDDVLVRYYRQAP